MAPMASPPASARSGPRVTTVLMVLLTAALVGFLAGALLATTTVPTTTGPTPSASPPSTRAPGPSPTPVETPTALPAITLSADREQADTRELIRLEGSLTPALAGVRLQVQQSVDGSEFSDFPVTATTRGDGTYGVWVRTGREGRNQFRTVTTLDGQTAASPAVVVVVR
jgi:hypothetical protein